MQEAHNKRQSPEICNEEEIRLTRLPTPPSRTQEPAGKEYGASGGPQWGEAGLQGATEGMWTGSGNEPLSNSRYSSTYAEEIRLQDRSERKRRVNKNNEADERARELRTMIDQDLVDEARRLKNSRERHEELVEEARYKVARPTLPLTSTRRMTGPGDLPKCAGTQLLHPRGPRVERYAV